MPVFLTDINLNGNELQNAIVQPLAVAPSNPKLGQIYCNSTEKKIMWYNGTGWKTVGVVVEASSTNGKLTIDGVEMTIYELPKATSSTLGGVMVGTGLIADSNGKISVGDSPKLGGKDPSYYAPASAIPTTLSALSNDTDFVSSTCSNLANYYKKNETYTQDEVNNLIGNLSTIKILVLDSATYPNGLESVSERKSNVIYLLPKASTEGVPNLYDEYLWTGSNFERIGDTTIDLSGYAKTADLAKVATSGQYSDLSGLPTLLETKSITLTAGETTKSISDTKFLAVLGCFDASTGEGVICDSEYKSNTLTVSINEPQTYNITIVYLATK